MARRKPPRVSIFPSTRRGRPNGPLQKAIDDFVAEQYRRFNVLNAGREKVEGFLRPSDRDR